ncbi:MAG: hypothetical protein AUK55_09970 [Syntrophobacteraceae bacterium CG2_30_61_12]|nr:MAG: hypothetical protein AUK55_09970 [Syntrophobacteraceae bacterium CG2_30_61_12]
MYASTKSNAADAQGLSGLFDDGERKALFRKYLFFLGWLEALIFVMCWFYQLGTDGYDRFGPIEVPFPWKAYFLVAFLAPVAITFLIGVVIVGFNRYLGKTDGATQSVAHSGAPSNGDGARTDVAAAAGRVDKVVGLARWLEKLPYLALLLLLGAAIGIIYHLDVVMGFIGAVGEKTIKAITIGAAALLAVLALLAFILLLFNYKLRKQAMDYRYRTQVAERFGLVILDDNTVLNHAGQLLIRGRKWKDSVPLLTAEAGTPKPAAPQPVEPEAKSVVINPE